MDLTFNWRNNELKVYVYFPNIKEKNWLVSKINEKLWNFLSFMEQIIQKE